MIFMYLLDSNIIIYYYDRDEKIIQFLQELGKSQYSISIITRMEVMMGTHSTLEETETYLDDYQNIDLHVDIVREAVLLDRKNPKKMKFKDLIIAATAKFHGLTLITADRSFEKIEGLKTLIYKP